MEAIEASQKAPQRDLEPVSSLIDPEISERGRLVCRCGVEVEGACDLVVGFASPGFVSQFQDSHGLG